MGEFLTVLLFAAMPALFYLPPGLPFLFSSVQPSVIGQSGIVQIVKFSLLAFTAGILISVSVEEMLTEAHIKPDPTFASVALPAGFAQFALLTVYLEG